MNIKKYLADSVLEAMDEIKRELGRDALILSQRKIRRKGIRGFFLKPQVEVVAAYEDIPSAPQQSPKRSRRIPYTNPNAQNLNFPPPPESFKNSPPPSPHQSFSEPGSGREFHTARALEALERLSSGGALPQNQPDNSLQTPPLAANLAYNRSAQHVRLDEPSSPPQAPDSDDGDFRELSVSKRFITERPTPPKAESAPNSIENKIDELSQAINAIAGKMNHSHDVHSYSPEVEALLSALLENETHEEFAHKLAKEVNDISKKKEASPKEVMEQLLRQYIGQPEPIKLKRYKRTVVLLIGPTGVGKTTTLAKLAAIYSINHHAKVGVITTDTYRIAAVEQLKTYAQILEIPLSIAYSPDEVDDALSEHDDKDIVFIDTAGKSPSDTTHEDEVKELIRHSDCDEIHLVISATTSFTGLLNILNAYSFLSDYRMIITKLDETPTWGTLLNAKFLTDRPISYTAIGQNVPDDIEVADVRKIVTHLMEKDH